MSADDSFTELDTTITMEPREQRRAFLITYSQADMTKVPSCLRFSEIVIEAFNSCSSNRKIVQWACCMEEHADGGKHYHLAILFSGSRRWLSIKNAVQQAHGISLHFSCQHVGYIAAYRYVLKDKQVSEVVHSPDHPNLGQINVNKTKGAMKSNRRKSVGKKRKQTNAEESTVEQEVIPKKRLSNIDISNFLVENNIKEKKVLFSVAKQRAAAGEPDLYSFIVSKNPKALSDLISTTWEIENASDELEQQARTRIDVVIECAQRPCREGCNGIWLQRALQVLRQNSINVYSFSTAVRNCIRHGRKKNNNVFLFGPTNSAKSFLLDPMEDMFKCFMNPADGKYAWVGLDECEVAILQDFRWHSDNISWNQMLLLLEGQTCHLPRPRNLFPSDMKIPRENTIPFFATSKRELEYKGTYNTRDEEENQMMLSRWIIFTFHHRIPQEKIIPTKACTTCFSKLVFYGADFED